MLKLLNKKNVTTYIALFLTFFMGSLYVYAEPVYNDGSYAPDQYRVNRQSKYLPQQRAYDFDDIVNSADQFFGLATAGMARAFEQIFSSYGYPDAYILGTEISASFVGGLRYGRGVIYSKNMKHYRVYWEGPSVGLDAGLQDSRLMILVYNLNNIRDLWQRFAGVEGSAYLVAGAGFNVLRGNDVLLIPIRTGVGAKLGLNVGYLKMSPTRSWNPF